MEEYMIFGYLLDKLVEEKLIDQHTCKEVKNILLDDVIKEDDKVA